MDFDSDESLSRHAEDIDLYYEQLVLLYWSQLKAFVTRRVKNAQDAEDIVQDAFMRAYYALKRYSVQQRKDLKARAWLYKITWNLYYNFISRSPQAFFVTLDASEDEALLEREDDKNEHPEQAFELVERRQELEALVATLPHHYQIVVSMYYFEELSLQEIADVLNQPLGTVKVYVRRGIRLLRKTLDSQANGVG